jgi:hypothetical protein
MSRHFTISVIIAKQILESYSTLGLFGYEAYRLLNGKGMFLEQNHKAVVPKVCSTLPMGYATSSQTSRGYSTVMATLKVIYFLN